MQGFSYSFILLYIKMNNLLTFPVFFIACAIILDDFSWMGIQNRLARGVVDPKLALVFCSPVTVPQAYVYILLSFICFLQSRFVFIFLYMSIFFFRDWDRSNWVWFSVFIPWYDAIFWQRTAGNRKCEILYFQIMCFICNLVW